MQREKADLGLLLVGILWGLGFVFVKIGLNEGVTPFYMLSIRFLIAFTILFMIFKKKLKTKSLLAKKLINGKDCKKL